MTLDQLRSNVSAYIAGLSMGGDNETVTNAIMADVAHHAAKPADDGVREAIADYRRHWWSFFNGWFRNVAEADAALETAERAKLFDPSVHRALSTKGKTP